MSQEKGMKKILNMNEGNTTIMMLENILMETLPRRIKCHFLGYLIPWDSFYMLTYLPLMLNNHMKHRFQVGVVNVKIYDFTSLNLCKIISVQNRNKDPWGKVVKLYFKIDIHA